MGINFSSLVLSRTEDNDRANLSPTLPAHQTKLTQCAVGTAHSTDGGPNHDGGKLLIKGILCYLLCTGVICVYSIVKSKLWNQKTGQILALPPTSCVIWKELLHPKQVQFPYLKNWDNNIHITALL